jgi:hypothetical protein
MRRQRTAILGISILGLLLYTGLCRAEGPTELDISPTSLIIGVFFSGREVAFSGSILSDRDIVIEIRGPEEINRLVLKRKVGLLWMNRDKVEIDGMPFLYAVLKPEGFKSDKQESVKGIGIESLKKRGVIHPDALSGSDMFDQFVKLKRSEKLYSGPDYTIAYTPAPHGRKQFRSTFYFPSSIVQGEYQVVANVIHGQTVEDTIVRRFQVKGSAVINGIQHLAHQRSLIYGILAVFVALAVGVFMGLVFTGGKSH